jgi:hypothetical protein
MGSEQGFQVGQNDPEIEDQTKNPQKNRLKKKRAAKPISEDVAVFDKKPEAVEEVDALAKSEPEKTSPPEKPPELEEARLQPTAPEASDDLSDTTEEISRQSMGEDLAEAVTELYEAPYGQIVTISLDHSGRSYEIPLRNHRDAVELGQPVDRAEETPLPASVLVERPFPQEDDYYSEYADELDSNQTNTFEDMVNRVLASETPPVEAESGQNLDLVDQYEAYHPTIEPIVAAETHEPAPPAQALTPESPRLIQTPTTHQPESQLHVPIPRTSPIVEANRANIPSVQSEQFDSLRLEEAKQIRDITDLKKRSQTLVERFVSPSSNIYDFQPTPETKPNSGYKPNDPDLLELPEVLDNNHPPVELPKEHRFEHSIWHSIEVDSKTGHAVDKPTFSYGHEFSRERAPERKDEADEEELAVASGQLAVGGITNVDMPLPQPIPFSLPPDSTQTVSRLSKPLSKLSNIELPSAGLTADFRTDFWLWLLLGLVVMADVIAAYS